MSESWHDGCELKTIDSDGNEIYDEVLREKCSGNNGVYRVAGSTLLFFILAAMAASCKPSANREAWPAKYVLFLFLVAATVFIPNEPLFSPILLNIFRAGAVLFILFNQLVILDIAYNLNESWVEKANETELEDGPGAGRKWLGALLGCAGIFYVGGLVAIGLMYHYFAGCSFNIAFITVTLIFGLVSTIVQLMGEEASLFTSASIFGYSMYLCYTAVSKNSDRACNPLLGEENISGIIMGIVVTVISILWTGYSYTAHKAVGEGSDEISNDEEKNKGVGGLVVNNDKATEDYDAVNDNAEGGTIEDETQTFSSSWKLNLILALICCWYAMSLTSWGSIENSGNIANPSAGDVGMWMVISSQWLMNALYLWTLLAPKIFHDRDFS